MENLKSVIYVNEYFQTFNIYTYENDYKEFILKVEKRTINDQINPVFLLHFENEKDQEQSKTNFIKMIKKAGFKKL